jgi:hypothetical protein
MRAKQGVPRYSASGSVIPPRGRGQGQGGSRRAASCGTRVRIRDKSGCRSLGVARVRLSPCHSQNPAT